MCVAPASWRVVIIRIPGSSLNAAMVPDMCMPGIPNTTSTPSLIPNPPKEGVGLAS